MAYEGRGIREERIITVAHDDRMCKCKKFRRNHMPGYSLNRIGERMHGNLEETWIVWTSLDLSGGKVQSVSLLALRAADSQSFAYVRTPELELSARLLSQPGNIFNPSHHPRTSHEALRVRLVKYTI